MHLLLFDGTCSLCNGVVQFVLARDRQGAFHFAPLQSEPARAYLAQHPELRFVDSLIVLPDYRTGSVAPLVKSSAALFVLGALGPFWRLLALSRVLPRSWRDTTYDWIARHRYRLFGKQNRCLIPNAAQRSRFLDLAAPPHNASRPS